MRPRAHVQLLASAVAVWAAFWVVGLPSYYQQYSFTLLLIGTCLLVPPTAWIGLRMLRRARPERRWSLALWMSFYFTIPLAVFDSLYCGVYLGHGARYLSMYWYLTVFYFIPWLIYVPMAWRMARP